MFDAPVFICARCHFHCNNAQRLEGDSECWEAIRALLRSHASDTAGHGSNVTVSVNFRTHRRTMVSFKSYGILTYHCIDFFRQILFYHFATLETIMANLNCIDDVVATTAASSSSTTHSKFE